MKVLLKLSKNKTNKKSIDYYEEVKIAYIQCEHMRKHFDSLRLSTTSTQITKELKMSPNQIRAIIKKHEEKGNAIANKKRQLSLSSKAYKLYSKGKTKVEVAIKLDIPQAHATQFHLEYLKLKGVRCTSILVCKDKR